jgi:hypothetical protein
MKKQHLIKIQNQNDFVEFNDKSSFFVISFIIALVDCTFHFLHEHVCFFLIIMSRIICC